MDTRKKLIGAAVAAVLLAVAAVTVPALAEEAYTPARAQRETPVTGRSLKPGRIQVPGTGRPFAAPAPVWPKPAVAEVAVPPAIGNRVRAGDLPVLVEPAGMNVPRKVRVETLDRTAVKAVRDGVVVKVSTLDDAGPVRLTVDYAKFRWAYELSQLNKPVDKAEWGMTPQTVNAYYASTKNEIVFPAAILQPPFFDPKADPAVNYGAIGGVIGHEITHGFDDQGRKSDGSGTLRDWWAADDAAKFEAQATRLGAQYEAVKFPQLPGMHITGRLTMGENIADLGGILLGLDAYKVSLKGQPAPALDGFTGEQRVFLGWGQVWRTLIRDDSLRQLLTTDPHSPGMVRAIAPLRNVDAWYEAFDVKEGEANYVKPEERVRIW